MIFYCDINFFKMSQKGQTAVEERQIITTNYKNKKSRYKSTVFNIIKRFTRKEIVRTGANYPTVINDFA